MADDDARDAEPLECGVERRLLEHGLAVNGTAIPERPLGPELRGRGESEKLVALRIGRRRLCGVDVALAIEGRQHAARDETIAQCEIARERRVHAFVDCKPLLRDHWRQAAVDVSGVVDDHECGPRAEPLAVAASRRECGLTREVAAWIGARE